MLHGIYRCKCASYKYFFTSSVWGASFRPGTTPVSGGDVQGAREKKAMYTAQSACGSGDVLRNRSMCHIRRIIAIMDP